MQDLCKMKLCYLALFVLLIKVCQATTGEPTPCEPGFSEQRYAFTVTRKVLERGRVLGKVSFNTCSAGTLALYAADDTRFRVFPDGKVTVKRPITLHDGSVSFVLNAWDAARKKHSVTVFVWNEREQQDTSHLLRRQKRDWTLPPVHLPENERGPFPKHLIQISSSKSNTNENIKYAISGKGADMPPIGVFIINAKTGFVMVSGPLDREKIDRYQLELRVLSETGENVEEPMTIFIHVTDQNDNRPVFTQSVFEGSVAEASPPGTSVLTVSATDPDDTIQSNNGILRYSILQQSPKEPSNAFAIADDTGVISVNAEGLSRQHSSKYTLTVRVADQEGHGYETTTKVIIAISKAESTEMSGSNPSLLTTHILNVAQGIPAKGVPLTLSKLDTRDEKWNQLSRSVTNEDGRCPSLLRGEPLTAGTYQMRFDTGQYWTQLEKESFYPYVEVVFTITDPSQKYHVPLLISPYSYSTYRGS